MYQNQLVRDHLFSNGDRIDAGHISSNSLLLDVTYGVTDKLALDVNIPYVMTAYHGTRPHPGSPLDDGHVHGTYQDFLVNVRYNVVNAGVVVTPFANIILPSHHYDYYGHAAPGRRLAEVQLGTYVGHVLTRGLPGVFMQARFSYGFAERPLERYHDRTNADAEIAYFVNPRVRVFALSATQYTFGGILLTHQFPNDLTRAEYLHHDQLAKSNLVDIGGGVQVQLTRRVDLVASYAQTVIGQNGHALARGLSVGASWGFGRSFSSVKETSANDPTGGLPRCLCQKGKSGP